MFVVRNLGQRRNTGVALLRTASEVPFGAAHRRSRSTVPIRIVRAADGRAG